MNNQNTQFNKGESKWKKVSGLRPGMLIAVPRNEAIERHKNGEVANPGVYSGAHLGAGAHLGVELPSGSLTSGSGGTVSGGGDVMWDEIVSVNRVGREQVYDIEVEGTHNFVGNNIFAHNTYITSGNLEVQGTASASYGQFANTIQVGAGGIASVSYSRFGVNTTTAGFLTGANDLLITGKLEVDGVTHLDGGTDLAETYYTLDPSIGAGDVVVTDYSLEAGVKKSDQPYSGSAVGVVSTNPSMVMGTVKQKNVERPVNIALVGRVPVKVGLESGPMAAGDLITSSSVPGVGMKATKPGRVLGMALEPLENIASGSYQEVLVFVNPHWWGGEADFYTVSASVSADYDPSQDNSLFGKIIKKFADALGVAFEKGLIRVGELVTGRIRTKELCVDDVCVTKEQFKSMLPNGGAAPASGPIPVPPVLPESSMIPTPSATPSPLATPALSTTPMPSVSPLVAPSPSSSPELPAAGDTGAGNAPPEGNATSASGSPTPTPTPEPTPSITATPEPTPSSAPEPTISPAESAPPEPEG